MDPRLLPLHSGAARAPLRTAELAPHLPARKFAGKKVDAVFNFGRDPFSGLIRLEFDIVQTLARLDFRCGPTSFGGEVVHFDHPAASAKAVAEVNAVNPP